MLPTKLCSNWPKLNKSLGEIFDLSSSTCAVGSFSKFTAINRSRISHWEESASFVGTCPFVCGKNKRKSATKDIEKQLIEKVAYLGIPNVRFECEITAKNSPDASGIDDLQFLFSNRRNFTF